MVSRTRTLVAAHVLAACVLAACASNERSAGAMSSSAPPPPAPESPVTAPSRPDTTQQRPVGTVPQLADTSWRLVEIQSMDDAIGTTKIDNRALYTMALGADGRAAMRLDCNRGAGAWSAEAAADAAGSSDSGRFALGPLAMTRAMCGPGSLDTRIGRDTQYMRTYLLEDGRLYVSLMADGGIYVWEPDPERAGTSR